MVNCLWQVYSTPFPLDRIVQETLLLTINYYKRPFLKTFLISFSLEDTDGIGQNMMQVPKLAGILVSPSPMKLKQDPSQFLHCPPMIDLKKIPI